MDVYNVSRWLSVRTLSYLPLPHPPHPPDKSFPHTHVLCFFSDPSIFTKAVPVTMVWNLTLEPGGLTVGYTDDGWALSRIRQTFKGSTRGTYLLCSFRSPKKKVFIITTFNITIKCFEIAFISTVWKSCRDRTKASGYSGPRDSHSNTIKCPLRLLQPQGHNACLLYPRPYPVFPLPVTVVTGWRIYRTIIVHRVLPHGYAQGFLVMKLGLFWVSRSSAEEILSSHCTPKEIGSMPGWLVPLMVTLTWGAHQGSWSYQWPLWLWSLG